MRRLPLSLGAALAASSLLLSACAGSTPAGGASDPIRLMVDAGITPAAAAGGVAFPGGAYGVQAAADAINAAGGINGRTLQIDVCDNKGDPNTSARCGRDAKSNGDIAVVGSFDSFGAASLLSVLESAKIPYIGGLPSSPPELTSPMSFQFNPGSNLGSFASALLYADSGCTKVVEIVSKVPGTDQIVAGVKAVLASRGVGYETQTLALDAANIQPILTSALALEPDCLSISGPPPVDIQVFTGARKLGYTGKLVTSVGSLATPFLPALGANAEGIIALSAALTPDSSDPMVAQYRKDMLAWFKGDEAKTAENLDEFSQAGWSSVQLVKQALEKAGGTASSEALIATMPTMCDVDVGNFYPHVNFCKPVTTSATFPRVYNNNFQYVVVKDGRYTATDGTWHDAASTIPT